MVKDIMHDKAFLKIKSEEATIEDTGIGQDLRDTLSANRESCVGMAANMIGVSKRITIINAGLGDIVMYNPVITKKEGAYKTEEGCLSLPGVRKCIRYKKIEVSYRDDKWNEHHETYTGFAAQIIQHEVNHCDGILI